MVEGCWDGGGVESPAQEVVSIYVKTTNGAKARWIQNGCRF